MKKVLASIGIGNATVATVLPSETVRPDVTLEAEVHITGGKVQQEVGTIRFEFETRHLTDDGGQEIDIDGFTLTDGLTIELGQEETRQVTIDILYSTPITLGPIEVWVETELAVDPEDKDYFEVKSTPHLQAVFDAVDDLGLSLRSAEGEADPYGRYASGQPGRENLSVFLEVDSRGGLLSELAEADERKTSITIDSTDAGHVREELKTTIESAI